MIELLRKIGIVHPIIQAPMAGVSTPAMAAAVSNAGALGSISVGAVDVDAARDLIRETMSLTKQPINVNVFCHRPAQRDAHREFAWLQRLAPEFAKFDAKPPAELSEIYQTFVGNQRMFAVFLELKPAVVSFHFGMPSQETIDALKKAGIMVIASATSLQEARSVEAASIDAVVAQGYEAGGHRGVFDPDANDDCMGSLALTRVLARELRIPVITAGGIMDGAGIAAALRLGASAVQMGTAFIDCDESSADKFFRAALHSDSANHTVMTRAISGRPARCLSNSFTALVNSDEDARQIPDYPVAYDAGKALNAAAKQAGNGGYGAHWAGQGAPLARTMPAAKMVEVLVAEMEEAVRSGRSS